MPEARHHPALGFTTRAKVYGTEKASPATLRELGNMATRTYGARYALNGQAAAAPLGSPVTIAITDKPHASEMPVPLGILPDTKSRAGVWALDEAAALVRLVPVRVLRF